jgi:hypothetical protein
MLSLVQYLSVSSVNGVNQSMKFLKGCLMAVGGFVLFVFIAALLFGRSGNQQSTSSSSSSLPSNSSKSPNATSLTGVTMANFSKLKTGMTYTQVVKILGKDGEELSSNEIGGVKTVMYKWDGDGFAANMNAMFQNNKLMSKSQFGLK